ncbi:MAG TPA: polysaccharide biosynthesis tyrosine autokinase [Verrucomicrobiae bacterium]|jgi:capsular exopolysaccharide synthesis family protein|nr:polysaccharide biosynthesis tyrosine autokinase [Verrucomicrobiae bacterium]
MSTTAVQPQIDFAQETHLKDYWRIVLRRKWIVVGFALLTTAIVGVMSFTTTPLYKASATIVVENEDSDVLNPADNSSKGVSYDIFENYIKTQMSLILSRSVAGKVFDELNMAELPRYQQEPHPVKRAFGAWMKKVSAFVNGKPVSDTKPDALALFLKDVELERVKGTRALQISVYNPEAELAAKAANAIAERYARDNMMRRALRFIRNQRMAALNEDYLRLKAQHDHLATLYGPKHHEMIMLRDEIRSLSEQIEKEKSNNGEFEESINKLVAGTAPEDEEKLLGDILHKIQETSVLSSSQMNNIVVADPAVAPTETSIPNKKRDLLVGLMGGLVVGIFLAFFVDYLDDTVKSEDDLKKIIGNENYMGAIPYDAHVKGFHKIAKMDRLVLQKPLSGSAEAYRLLRTQLKWITEKNPYFKDFAVVSSIPDEGKSTIASNLAISLSQLGQKILLVDTDIRRGRLQRTYETPTRLGLGQFLTDGLRFTDIVQKTKIPNLWIITPGESVIMGSELLSSARTLEFIQETRKYFDLIIYDTAPITLLSDASVLLSHLYGAILVTRTGVTQGRLIQKSIRMVHAANTKLIGVVLNSATQDETNQYYSRYYRD